MEAPGFLSARRRLLRLMLPEETAVPGVSLERHLRLQATLARSASDRPPLTEARGSRNMHMKPVSESSASLSGFPWTIRQSLLNRKRMSPC